MRLGRGVGTGHRLHPAGNVILASYGDPVVGGGIDFGVGTFPTYSSDNLFFSAYTASGPDAGKLRWAKHVPMILLSDVFGVGVDSQGHIVVSGNYSGSMQVDGRLLVTSDSEQLGVFDSFLGSFAEPSPSIPTIGTGSVCQGLTFTTVPEDIVVPATSPAGACVFFMPPTSTGPTVTCKQAPNTTYTRGATTVNCTAFDAYGNSASAQPFTVTVTDPPPPVLTASAHRDHLNSNQSEWRDRQLHIADRRRCPPQSEQLLIVRCAAPARRQLPGTAARLHAAAGFGDVPAGLGHRVCHRYHPRDVHLSGRCGGSVRDGELRGHHPRFATHADGSGERHEAGDRPERRRRHLQRVRHRFADGTDPVTCSAGSGSTFAITTTPVTCSATNKAGMTSSASFTVTVLDTAPTLMVPASITTNATGPSGAFVTYSVSATDFVDGTDTGDVQRRVRLDLPDRDDDRDVLGHQRGRNDQHGDLHGDGARHTADPDGTREHHGAGDRPKRRGRHLQRVRHRFCRRHGSR